LRAPKQLAGSASVMRESNGDVAQLGEHCLCKAGVAGSTPVVSTDDLRRAGDILPAFLQGNDWCWGDSQAENKGSVESPVPGEDDAGCQVEGNEKKRSEVD
jgi:hypothetical protein